LETSFGIANDQIYIPYGTIENLLVLFLFFWFTILRMVQNSMKDSKDVGNSGQIADTFPKVGMLARLRGRRGVVSSVEVYPDSIEGNLHLVRVEYTDSLGITQDEVLWEREVGATVLEPNALPSIDEKDPLLFSEYKAFLRSVRWSSLLPLTKMYPEWKDLPPISAPFFGAVQAEDFQLEPMIRAMKMNRISLLIADDVGLGKTIVAGFILRDLIQRRRIRKVLVLTPASLREQWKTEILTKFAIQFDIVDRLETEKLQKRIGMEANPWKTFQHIITSFHYLKQDDILSQFYTTCEIQETHPSAKLPWDLLIVDEAHNLMPHLLEENLISQSFFAL
jgi:hypothetical protein